MSIDVLFKKYFYAVVCALVALAAYFQASGISYLVSSQLAVNSGPTFEAAPKAASQAHQAPKALAIHERNPFDHVTGSLIGKEVEESAPSKPTFDDPLTVPACPGVTIHTLSEADDPFWSVAAIKGPGDQSPTLRRVGDKVGSDTVAYIGFNPTTQSPTVWLEGSSLCQTSLFGIVPPPPASAPAAEAEVAEEEQPATTRKGGSHAVDPDIASKIKKISDTEFEIDRSAVDKILENQGALMKSARIVPEQKDGKTIGVRLFGVRPESLLGMLGLKNGDRLETINGFNMGSPEKALEAYARLRTANNLKLTVNRRGKDMAIDMKIK